LDRSSKRFVAIVDDDGSVRSALLGLMKAAGRPARAFASAEEYLAAADLAEAACLVADVRMPGMSGLDLQARLAVLALRIPIVFITAHGDAATSARALAAGAVRIFQKPFDDQELLDVIEAVTQAGAGQPRGTP
jgi:FixJ family two-component response regulator